MLALIWTLSIGGIVLIMASIIGYEGPRWSGTVTAITAVSGALALAISIILGIAVYYQHNARTEDAIRVALDSQGYNVLNVGNDTTSDHDHTYYYNGWGATVSRKDDPSCSGSVNVVIRGGKVTITNHLPCYSH